MDSTNWWADEVERRSAGRIEIEFFYGGSLVAPFDLLAAVQDGRVTGGSLFDPYWPADFPLWQAVGIPFVTTDPEALNHAWHELYESYEPFRAEFERAGVHVLHFVPYSTSMVGSRRPLRSVEDLAGQRLRAVGYVAEALRELGAEPAAVDATEMYESIQRGVLDGYAAIAFESVIEFALQEVAPYTVDLGLGHYASHAIGIDLEFWEQLPQDLQDLVGEVSDELREGRAIAELVANEDAACERYLAEEIDLVVWAQDEVDEVRARLGDAVEERWRADAIERGVEQATVDEFYELLLETYERSTGSSTYEDPVARCLTSPE